MSQSFPPYRSSGGNIKDKSGHMTQINQVQKRELVIQKKRFPILIV